MVASLSPPPGSLINYSADSARQKSSPSDDGVRVSGGEHPYREPILGHQSLLETLTVEELRQFYAAQYHPGNVTIACVGHLDGAALPELITQSFGAWPRGRIDPSQSLVPQEPPALSPKSITTELPLQTAYVCMPRV